MFNACLRVNQHLVRPLQLLLILLVVLLTYRHTLLHLIYLLASHAL